MFGRYDGYVFNMLAVDLAEYSTVKPEAVTVRFVGYRAEGYIVTTNLTTDGIFDGGGSIADFETLYFGPEFSNLIRVEIPTFGWSLDNLRLSVPEPTAASLEIVGFTLWRLFRGRKRTLRS